MMWNDAYVVTPPSDGEYLVQVGRNFHTAQYENKTWKIHGTDEKQPDYWVDVNSLEENEEEKDDELD